MGSVFPPIGSHPSLLGHVPSLFACQLDKSFSVRKPSCRTGKLAADRHGESQACNSYGILSCSLPLSEESSFLDRIFLFRPRLPFFVSPPFSPSPPTRPEQLSACLAIVFYGGEEKQHKIQQALNLRSDLWALFSARFWYQYIPSPCE